MSNDTSKQKVEERLKQVFANPQTAAAVADVLVRNKPPGWSRRSCAPYYKERYALEMKDVLDGMMADRKDRVYRYDEFLAKFGVSKESLYLRVNQSLRYLLENMDDDDHTYGRFQEMITITRERNIGICIRFIPEFREGDISNFKPESVRPKDEAPKWKQRIDDYLEDGEVGQPLLVDNLCLTPDEIATMKASFGGVKGLIYNVTSKSIKLVKTNYIPDDNS